MGKDRKTLIILIPGFPADEDDSTCVPFPQAFVQNLKHFNPALNVIVLSFQYPFRKSIYKWNGVVVHSFNGRNRGKLNRVRIWIQVWARLKNIFREEQVVGILSFWLGETALIAKYVSRKYDVQSFTWMLGQDARDNNRYVSLIKPNSETLIALSDFLADEMERNYHTRPLHIIPPGIDQKTFTSEFSMRNIDILGVGSLIPLKQYGQFIEIIALVVKTHPGIKVVICGEGPERGHLQQLIYDWHLHKHIELRGELKHEKILELMQEARILMHPSSYEGFSTVCAEALYAGVQVVSYCKPMHIDFENFHIVRTPEEMRDKVVKILNEKDQNQHRVLTYPIEEICGKVLSLFNCANT